MTQKLEKVTHVFESLVFILAVLLSAEESFATDDLRALLTARTAQEFARRLNQQKIELKENRICDVQLRTAKIPVGCFRLLKMESVNRPISLIIRKEKLRDLKWLETFCVRRAAQSSDRRELAAAGNEPSLPERCRTAARARAEDFNYIDESEHPAALFRRDHELDSGAP